MKTGRLQTGLLMAARAGAVAAALLASGCATVSMVDAQTAVNGKSLDTALNLYGPFDEHLTIGGKSYYVWRKMVTTDQGPLGCELRAEVAYRDLIREAALEGFPAACQQFSVRYTAASDQVKPPEAPATQAAAKTASGCPGCRPVGGPTATASAAPQPGPR